jgi:hypothetical protein
MRFGLSRGVKLNRQILRFEEEAMRGGLKAAIAAIVVALGIGALLASWDGGEPTATATSGSISEGRASTSVDPAHPDAPVIRDVPAGSTAR